MKTKIYLIFSIFVCFGLLGKDYPIKQIETKLYQAETDFEIAKKMFNPWFAGPLLTGSGNVLPRGYVNINPQLQVTDYYAAFDNSGESIPIPSIIEVNPSISLGVGIYNRIDLTVVLACDFQEQSDESFFGWQDNSLRLSLALMQEQPYYPAIKFSVKEIFPTGKYKNLDPQKAAVQGLGDGAYKTEFGLTASKVIWEPVTHPMQLRFAFIWGIVPDISLTNFNSYGGGYGTKGKIKSGNYYKVNFGYELSITQKVVWALDLAYEFYEKRIFAGIKGTNEDGTPAFVGYPTKYLLSMAPAIEYNFTQDITLASGIWFSICGKNKLNFVAGIVSFSYGF